MKDGQRNKKNWNIVTYGDIYWIYDRLAKCKNVKAFQLIKHTDDVDEDGVLKPEHVHIVLELHDRRYTNTVRNLLYRLDENGKPITVMAMECVDLKAAIDYLTHKNHPEKFQYSEDAVLRYGRMDIEGMENEYYIMVKELREDQITPIQAVQRYGEKFIKNARNIAFVMKWQHYRKEHTTNYMALRDMERAEKF